MEKFVKRVLVILKIYQLLSKHPDNQYDVMIFNQWIEFTSLVNTFSASKCPRLAIQITTCCNFPCDACILNQSARISRHELLTECIANVCEKPCDSCCILHDNFVNTEINVNFSLFRWKKCLKRFEISSEIVTRAVVFFFRIWCRKIDG